MTTARGVSGSAPGMGSWTVCQQAGQAQDKLLTGVKQVGLDDAVAIAQPLAQHVGLALDAAKYTHDLAQDEHVFSGHHRVVRVTGHELRPGRRGFDRF
jgi:hypothetical protein